MVGSSKPAGNQGLAAIEGYSGVDPAEATVAAAHFAATAAIVSTMISAGGFRASGDELAALIRQVQTALLVADEPASDEPVYSKATPAEAKKSIRSEGLISFIDGKSYKTLKRHLTSHGLTPNEYRARYGLPADYPMVASSYAEQRSKLAKQIGLGTPGRMAGNKTAAAA